MRQQIIGSVGYRLQNSDGRHAVLVVWVFKGAPHVRLVYLPRIGEEKSRKMWANPFGMRRKWGVSQGFGGDLLGRAGSRNITPFWTWTTASKPDVPKSLHKLVCMTRVLLRPSSGPPTSAGPVSKAFEGLGCGPNLPDPLPRAVPDSRMAI